MNTQEYIESGILELYVAGALSEKENSEVFAALQEHSEVKKEVEEIEEAMRQLSAALSPTEKIAAFQVIKDRLDDGGKVIPLLPIEKPPTNWFAMTGWAASVLLVIGLGLLYTEFNSLKQEYADAVSSKTELEESIAQTSEDLNQAKELVAMLRDKNVQSYTLGGQAVSPESYAKVFWNKETQQVFVDAAGLPPAPEGKVYQVWSLKLDPLTPTSLGLLDELTDDGTGIINLPNANESQAFGITLEPAGGSESPTLEQLYVLGTV